MEQQERPQVHLRGLSAEATPAWAAVNTEGSSHPVLKLNFTEFRSRDARDMWPLKVLRTSKRKGGKQPAFMTGLLFTRKCWLLDNLDKNVTASLRVLQIHGVKPLEQLMESSHIISR